MLQWAQPADSTRSSPAPHSSAVSVAETLLLLPPLLALPTPSEFLFPLSPLLSLLFALAFVISISLCLLPGPGDAFSL